MSNGKGSKRRPMTISNREFDKRWLLAFGDDKQCHTRLRASVKSNASKSGRIRSKTVGMTAKNGSNADRRI